MPFPKTASRSTRRWLLLAALLLICAGLAVRILNLGEEPDAREAGLSFAAKVAGQEATQAAKSQPETVATPDPTTPASETPVAHLAPAPVAPHRAPEALRLQDRKRMRDEPDLGAYANELKARADSGDADAAMALSDLHRTCQRASTWANQKSTLTEFDRSFYGVIGVSADQLAVLDAARRSIGSRCAKGLALIGANASQLAESWAARAAAMGHPGARLEAEARNLSADTPSDAALERGRQLGLELLRQRDPLDLLRYAHPLSLLSTYERTGFVMAACLLNAQCAADPLAYVRDGVDARAYSGFPDFLTLSFLGPRDFWISERQAEEIVSLWRAGRFDLILPRDLSSSGGDG